MFYIKGFTLAFLGALSSIIVSCAQLNDVPLRLRTIVKNMEDYNRVDGRKIGRLGKKSWQYENFIKLQKKATIKELEILTNYPSPVVRCYAFWALAKNPEVDILPFIIQNIEDYEPVKTQFGCIGSSRCVISLFITFAYQHYSDSILESYDPFKKKMLDSLQAQVDEQYSLIVDSVSREQLDFYKSKMLIGSYSSRPDKNGNICYFNNIGTMIYKEDYAFNELRSTSTFVYNKVGRMIKEYVYEKGIPGCDDQMIVYRYNKKNQEYIMLFYSKERGKWMRND